jgi:hypothetical protein
VLRDLASDQVRAIVAGHGYQQVGASGTDAVKKDNFRAVTVHDHLAEFLAKLSRSATLTVDEHDLVVWMCLQFKCECVTDRTRADHDDVHA